jgi:hypothetical protein
MVPFPNYALLPFTLFCIMPAKKPLSTSRPFLYSLTLMKRQKMRKTRWRQMRTSRVKWHRKRKYRLMLRRIIYSAEQTADAIPQTAKRKHMPEVPKSTLYDSVMFYSVCPFTTPAFLSISLPLQ